MAACAGLTHPGPAPRWGRERVRQAAFPSYGRWALFLAGLLSWGLPPGQSGAASITVEGLTFSDELGGFRLLSVTGRGLPDDPFVVVEEITGAGGSVLVIRGLGAPFGNRVGSQHLVGFALTKVAINRTGGIWSEYELELRERLAAHSPYGDGLSFGQATSVGRPFGSSAFKENHLVEEPYDSVSFSDGLVAPEAAASFQVIVTDTSPAAELYLLQQPLRPVAERAGAPRFAQAQE